MNGQCFTVERRRETLVIFIASDSMLDQQAPHEIWDEVERVMRGCEEVVVQFRGPVRRATACFLMAIYGLKSRADAQSIPFRLRGLTPELQDLLTLAKLGKNLKGARWDPSTGELASGLVDWKESWRSVYSTICSWGKNGRRPLPSAGAFAVASFGSLLILMWFCFNKLAWITRMSELAALW